MRIKTFMCVVLLMPCFFMAGSAFAAVLAHYTFDDSGDRYQDVTGNGYDGSADGSGTTFVPSGVGGLNDAMSSTTSGRILVNTPFNSVSLSGFAISFWATSGTDWDNWISFGGTDNFWIQEYSGGGSLFLYNNGGVSGYASYDISTDIGGPLQHIVLSADTSAEVASIYVNGSLTDTGAWTVSSDEKLGYLTIGGARNTTVRNIGATIDDVQIYDAPLSSDDVSYLHSNPGSVIDGSGSVPEPFTLHFFALFGAVVFFIRHRRVNVHTSLIRRA